MVNAEILKFFASYIEKELGIIYSETNFFQLEHRLNEIVKLSGLTSIQELYDKSKTGIQGPMRSLLLDIATNNETSFFRDINMYKGLSSVIIPELLQKTQKKDMYFWSAASSSGQESYSILMEIEQQKAQGNPMPNIRIFASDISDIILKKAMAGVYSQLEVQRGLNARQLMNFFDKEDEFNWKIKSLIRSQVQFSKINLLDEWGKIGPFDIVFCRNVLIYYKIENKTKVVEKIKNVLNPGGYLILGAAESLLGISNDFEQINLQGSVAYRKK